MSDRLWNWTNPNGNSYIGAESELLDEGRVFFSNEEIAAAFAGAFPVNSGGHQCTPPRRTREGTFVVLRAEG